MIFKKFQKLKTKHQVLLALVVGFTVISFWRGLWGLLDVYLLPNSYLLSS